MTFKRQHVSGPYYVLVPNASRGFCPRPSASPVGPCSADNSLLSGYYCLTRAPGSTGHQLLCHV